MQEALQVAVCAASSPPLPDSTRGLKFSMWDEKNIGECYINSERSAIQPWGRKRLRAKAFLWMSWQRQVDASSKGSGKRSELELNINRNKIGMTSPHSDWKNALCNRGGGWLSLIASDWLHRS